MDGDWRGTLRFEPNLSILWPDLPLLERPAAAARAGFDAAELWWPFAGPEPGAREVDDLVDAFGSAGIRLVLLNLWLGDPAAGHHGLLSVAAERSAFRANVEAAAAVVRRLGGSIVNSHVGNVPAGVDPEAVRDEAAASVAWAAPRIAAAGATLVVEALNPFDFPRYGASSTATAISVVDRARDATDAPVGILFDVYHAVRSGEDPLAEIDRHARDIAHVQVADVPGRGAPGTGAVPFDRVFAALALWYGGYVGLEYRPSDDEAATFGWLYPTSGMLR